MKYHVKSYSHGIGEGNHPVKMDVKTITQTTEYNFFVLMLYEKFMMSALARVKTIKYCSFCTAKVSNSIIARVRNSRSHFQSNLNL